MVLLDFNAIVIVVCVLVEYISNNVALWYFLSLSWKFFVLRCDEFDKKLLYEHYLNTLLFGNIYWNLPIELHSHVVHIYSAFHISVFTVL